MYAAVFIEEDLIDTQTDSASPDMYDTCDDPTEPQTSNLRATSPSLCHDGQEWISQVCLWSAYGPINV